MDGASISKGRGSWEISRRVKWNIALLGHGGSGKTSLAEALLFTSGATSRLGSVNDQTSVLDYEPEEHSRGGSIATSLAWLEHDGHKLNLLDTPGDQILSMTASMPCVAPT